MQQHDDLLLVDARTAATYVAHLRGQPCAPGTIWAWASRGHIQRHGRGRYNLHEIHRWVTANNPAVSES